MRKACRPSRSITLGTPSRSTPPGIPPTSHNPECNEGRSARRREWNHLGKLGTVERAIEYNEQALVISKEIGDRRSEAIHLYNLGNLYQEEGDQQRAYEMYEQSLEIKEKVLPSDHPSIHQAKEAIHSLEDHSS